VKKALFAVPLLFLLVLPLEAQVARGGNRMQAAGPARRMQLQRQVLQRFVEQNSRELGLTAQERGRIEQILLDSNSRRDELFAEAAVLRGRLATAMRDATVTDETLNGILNELVELREREHQVWRREQDELARTLPARKRAQLTLRLLRLQERIREMIEQRPGARGDTAGSGAPQPERTPGS
jgi:hypothetical protein